MWRTYPALEILVGAVVFCCLLAYHQPLLGKVSLMLKLFTGVKQFLYFKGHLKAFEQQMSISWARRDKTMAG